MASGYKQTVFGLLRKHDELLLEIEQANTMLTAKQSALDAIEAAIRVFDPTYAPATDTKRRGIVVVEGLHRFILDTMRRDGSVTTLGVATALLEDRGQDSRDRALLSAMRKRVGDALQKMRRQGRVIGARYGNGVELCWQIAT